jgi:hypothetical protein
MITVFVEQCNTFSQENYDFLIDNIAINTLSCPHCEHSGCFSVHGYYCRRLKVYGNLVTLRIMRVVCSDCGHTHAILTSTIVPYSQIRYEDQKEICEHFEAHSGYDEIMSENPCIDENNIAYVLKKYRGIWKKKLSSLLIKVSDDILQPCFDNFERQFMQIKRTINALIRAYHIT